jgi:acylphosphatase
LPETTVNTVRIIVSGLVQGVGFRYYVYREARSLGLNGYVKNLPTGQVEVVALGDKGLIDELVKTLRVGPGYASIAGVQLEEVEIEEDFKDFSIR